MENPENSKPTSKDSVLSLPELHRAQLDEVHEKLSHAERIVMEGVDRFVETGIRPVGVAYREFSEEVGKTISQFLKQINTAPPEQVIEEAVRTTAKIERLLERFSDEKFDAMQATLQEGLDQWLKDWDTAQESIPVEVERKLSAEQLKSNTEDDKRLRKAKKRLKLYGLRSSATIQIPSQEIFIHFRDVSAKPAAHRALGGFSLRIFKFITQLRQETSRQLKVLVLSLDKDNPDERIELLTGRAEDFEKRITTIVQEAENLISSVQLDLQMAVRDSFNRVARMSDALDVVSAIKKRQKRVNQSALELLNKRLNNFPGVWRYNQDSFHRQLRADLSFGKVSLSIFRLSRNTRQRVSAEFIVPLEENLKQLESGLETLRNTLESKKSVEQIQPIRINDQLFLNTQVLITHLETTTDGLSQNLPESSKLIHKEVEFEPLVFTKKLRTINIAVNRIADYLIKTNFTENHRHALIQISQQLKRLNNRLINSANLISYSVEIAKEEESYKSIQDVLDKAVSELTEVRSSLTELKEEFLHEILNGQNNTLSSMDLMAVVSRADQLKQYVSREPVVKPLNKWFEKWKSGFNAIRNKIRLFIVRRKYEVMLAQFAKKNENIVNEGEQIQNFIESLKIDPEIDRQLPYYYKQLFSGKHLSNAAGVRIRQKEIDLAKTAIDRIQRGAGGAIAITGDAMTGKTFLANYIATHLIQGKVYRVSPPMGGANNAQDLEQAIISACGKSRGNVNSVLASLEPGSVLIINDLEQWWLKHMDGDEAIIALSGLIEKFGKRHYFLLSCNSISFRLISNSSDLQNVLASSIAIEPATQEQMREIIWLRHSTGGMEVESAGKKVEQLLGGAWDSLLNKFYRRSNGNVGLALHFWLRSIDAVEGETIKVKDKGLRVFPEIKNANWKVLIYQLFIHRTLSYSRLKLLFEDEDPQWLRQNLSALSRVGLIAETGRLTYSLNPTCRPYIERWFTEIQLIS